MKTGKGMALFELLVVLGILGLLLSLATVGRRYAQGQEKAGFLTSLQNFFWQGTTEAASRGRTLTVYYTGGSLELRDETRVLSALKVPSGINLSLTQGPVARLTPPGKVQTPSGGELSAPLRIDLSTEEGRRYSLEVSLIGEARLRRSP
ncbi:MAG: type IV pilin [Thermaceae bacterium]